MITVLDSNLRELASCVTEIAYAPHSEGSVWIYYLKLRESQKNYLLFGSLEISIMRFCF